jgi:hypothetical protein
VCVCVEGEGRCTTTQQGVRAPLGMRAGGWHVCCAHACEGLTAAGLDASASRTPSPRLTSYSSALWCPWPLTAFLIFWAMPDMAEEELACVCVCYEEGWMGGRDWVCARVVYAAGLGGGGGWGLCCVGGNVCEGL